MHLKKIFLPLILFCGSQIVVLGDEYDDCNELEECEEYYECYKRPPALLSLGANLLEPTTKHARWGMQIEYKGKPTRHHFRLLTGAMGTDKGAFYFYLGACYDLHLFHRFYLVPAFSPGIYIKGGDKNLGFPLEFRSCLELAYEFPFKGRLGTQAFHISNGSLSSHNPGLNAFSLFFAYPL